MNKKIAKKISFYITFSACIAALWMLVVRFDYPIETFVTYIVICVVFLFVVMAAAALVAFLIRYFSSAKAASNDSQMFANLTSKKSVFSNSESKNSEKKDTETLKPDESKHEYE